MCSRLRRTLSEDVRPSTRTRYVYVAIHARRDGKTAAAFLKRFRDHFPAAIHTILTDNGSEFTDRFAVDMPGKPEGKPSGNHHRASADKALQAANQRHGRALQPPHRRGHRPGEEARHRPPAVRLP